MKKRKLWSLLAGAALFLNQNSYCEPSNSEDEEETAIVLQINKINHNEEEKYLKKALTYEQAAEKRRNAAEAQKKRAEELLSDAQEKKFEVYLKTDDKKRNMELVGNLELRAGDLEGKAYRNYECAANNLFNAVKIYKLIPKGKENKLPSMEKQQLEDAKNAKLYYDRTIEAYLAAAITFSPNNADNPEKEAEANIRAAIELEYKAKKE